jgi:uncharacterized membrane protein YeaQ/YmgE (transglycosylase-associated protein family)
MIVFLLSLFLVGLIAGGLARLIVPGPDPIGIFGTALLGIVGSFVGGLLASLIFGHSLRPGRFGHRRRDRPAHLPLQLPPPGDLTSGRPWGRRERGWPDRGPTRRLDPSGMMSASQVLGQSVFRGLLSSM